MQLMKDGRELSLRDGRVWVKAAYSEGTGIVTLCLEDWDSGAVLERTFALAPWSPDAYEVEALDKQGGLVLCGAARIMVLRMADLSFVCGIGLEYQEGETIERPWTRVDDDENLVLIATERRVLCLNRDLSLRWSWSAQTGPESVSISGAPRIENGRLFVPLESFRAGRREVSLSLDSGGSA